jgi:hypothetical protein
MKTKHMLTLALAAVVVVGAGAGALAQEKQRFSTEGTHGIFEYEEQHAIDVGDVPGHQVRVLSAHTVYPNTQEAIVFDGIKVKEQRLRALTDYTEANGHTTGHEIYLLENGDKIFGKYDGTAQTTVNADTSKVTRVYAIITLTGGTGKFKGIRGTLRTHSTTDFKNASGSTEGEYWLE